jgi:hypothetical protein
VGYQNNDQTAPDDPKDENKKFQSINHLLLLLLLAGSLYF